MVGPHGQKCLGVSLQNESEKGKKCPSRSYRWRWYAVPLAGSARRISDVVRRPRAKGPATQFRSASTWATACRIWATPMGLLRNRRTANAFALASAPG